MSCVTRGSGSDIRDNDVSEDSDEDDKLKQALVLVDLLKNGNRNNKNLKL